MTYRAKELEPGFAKVSSVISGLALSGTISLESVARQLETSPRTLQRRLNGRGLNFWALVEQSRFEIASALLRETGLKVREIGKRLGYSTPSAFTRAFTKWAGCSPVTYRNDCEVQRHGVSEWREMGRPKARPHVAFVADKDLSEEFNG